MSQHPTGPACGNNPNHQLTPGDRQAVADFKAYLAGRAGLRDRIAEAMARADGWSWAAANFSSLSTPAADRYRRCAEEVLAVLPEPADRAAVLLWAAGIADDEAAFLYEDMGQKAAAGARYVANRLRRMADEAQQQLDTETRAVPLATTCAYCGHRFDEHNRFGCCVGNQEVRCGCGTFVVGEKPAPVDPRTILGIDADAPAPVQQPAADADEARQDGAQQ